MAHADPITTEVVRNFVISCAQDMNAALWRSAFSAIIYEGRDSAVALLDEEGNMLGQSTGVPLFVGAIDACVKLVLDRYGDDIHPGDIFILNDSYLQGTHLHDVTAIGPLFYKDELVGFGAARAHWQDIGAIDPGSTMGSTSIFHEGLRLGPTRIVSRFKRIPEWYDLLTRNTRLKDMTIGDLNAQITAIRTGERRLGQILDRIGADTYRAACANIFEQARLLDREAIAKLKDGTYSREGYLDDDGVGTEPVKVALSLTIEGERMIIDLDGSSGPVEGSINCGAVQTGSLLRLAYKTMINPDRAITGGSFSTMEVRIPEKCMFNAKEPAACEWYFTGLGLLADLMISCLGEAMPHKATAAHYGDSMVAAFFDMDPERGQWISVEPTAGGWGGTVGQDGESALINLVNGGFRNLPAEVYETKFPVRVEEFSLRRDSGGAGRWRGGCGVVRSYRLLDDCFGALWFERSKTPAWGIKGGSDGAGPDNDIVLPDGSVEKPLKMRAKRFPKGTLVVTRTGGGGGYGDPRARPENEVLADVLAGTISREAAHSLYGVTVTEAGAIDAANTEPRRQEAAPG
ncbi:hydantoinase B/oxoprolinase family protein [Nitratireductor sp. CAU 1489]|uniref:Hydantoinase B/oxoprolinase family protein n=1 Tax=Nitratireductor arenosus TaxID=2682096 RepID=A0A844QKT1_9HYPH|nr:hydantoinase B/oxoprolinase family protein [Nitratireductor arenosus]MVA98623.1 hydantoinase B/oxoprolinase family protein [Nitratireductor arenosus]